MSEFADLLKEAAGEPPRPLNMATVRQRAARLGVRRRAGTWAGALLATISIGVPTGVALVPSEEHPTDVRTVEEQVRPQPDVIVDPAIPRDSHADRPAADAPRRVQTNTTVGVTPTPAPPPAGATVTTIGGGDTPESDDEDRCTRAGPIAAECGEAGATTCWATRVGCPSTTTTTTTTTTTPPRK